MPHDLRQCGDGEGSSRVMVMAKWKSSTAIPGLEKDFSSVQHVCRRAVREKGG